MKAELNCGYAFISQTQDSIRLEKGAIVDIEFLSDVEVFMLIGDRKLHMDTRNLKIIDTDEWNEKLAEYKAKIDATKRRDMVVVGESLNPWAKGWDGQNNDRYKDTLITGIQKLLSCGGNEIIMVSLERWDYVYLLYKDGVLVDFISVYDEGGFEVNEKKGFVVIWGHEDVHILWVEDLEANRYATR